MEKAGIRKKLNLKFKTPAGLMQIQQGLADLNSFAGYFSINEDSLLAQRDINLIQRLGIYAQSPAAPQGEAEIPELAEGAKEPETPREQWLYNVEQVILFLNEASGRDINLALLQEIHTHLTYKLEHANLGGRLRTAQRNLFSYIEDGVLLPENDELKSYLHDLFVFCGDKKVSAFERAFIFFYVLTAIRPFDHENEVVAILGANHILEREKAGLFGLLNLEKHLFFNSKYLLETVNLFGEQNYMERLDADLTPFLDICLAHFSENILQVKKTLMDCVREEYEFEKLTPRLKNNLNFWLEKAFFIHKDKLKDLTPRQHDILTLLSKYGQLATKDLVPVFRVDRKTIQRDFNIMQEFGFVEQRGGGRNMKYFFDFKIRC